MDTPTPGFTANAAFDPNGLFAGDHSVYTRDITLVSGAGNLVAGTVLGRITSGGKFKKSLTASNDGSETPVAILGEDKDATSADKQAIAYFAGGFKEGRLTFGTAHTKDTTWLALAARGIYLYAEQLY